MGLTLQQTHFTTIWSHFATKQCHFATKILNYFGNNFVSVSKFCCCFSYQIAGQCNGKLLSLRSALSEFYSEYLFKKRLFFILRFLMSTISNEDFVAKWHCFVAKWDSELHYNCCKVRQFCCKVELLQSGTVQLYQNYSWFQQKFVLKCNYRTFFCLKKYEILRKNYISRFKGRTFCQTLL